VSPLIAASRSTFETAAAVLRRCLRRVGLLGVNFAADDVAFDPNIISPTVLLQLDDAVTLCARNVLEDTEETPPEGAAADLLKACLTAEAQAERPSLGACTCAAEKARDMVRMLAANDDVMGGGGGMPPRAMT